MAVPVDSSPSTRRGRRVRTVAVLAAAALGLAACSDDRGPGVDTSGPAPSVTTTSAATTTTASGDTSAPGLTSTTEPGPTTTSTTAPPVPGVELPPPLENDGGDNDALTGVGRLTGQGSDCTAFLVDTAAADAAAYALTNGHCVGLFDSTTVIVDGPGGGTVAFNRFVDTDDVEAGVAAVRWATMRGVDLAVLELDATLGDLRDQGIAAYRLGPFAAEATGIRVVGVPVTGVDPDEYYLRAADCAAGRTTRLLEFVWVWDAAQANDCDTIVGGNSGSPVFDPGGNVVGIINTTTVAASAGGECYLGDPCEVTVDGARVRTDTSYAMPVDGIAACFTAAGGFDPTACGIEAAPPEATLMLGAPVQSSPAAWDVTIAWAGGAPPAADATAAPGVAAQAGPIGTTDCRQHEGYAPTATDTLPALPPGGEGFYLACLAPLTAAGVDTSAASFAVLQVDDTPPVAQPELSILETGEGGFSVEPIFATPELSDFVVKIGRFAATDCADPDGYVRYRRIPLRVAADELPASVCVIGFDLADNPSPPARFELD